MTNHPAKKQESKETTEKNYAWILLGYRHEQKTFNSSTGVYLECTSKRIGALAMFLSITNKRTAPCHRVLNTRVERNAHLSTVLLATPWPPPQFTVTVDETAPLRLTGFDSTHQIRGLYRHHHLDRGAFTALISKTHLTTVGGRGRSWRI